MTLQLGSAQLNDSASLSLFQILGRVSDKPSSGQMSILGSVTKTGGALSHGIGIVPPRVMSRAESPRWNMGREKGMFGISETNLDLRGMLSYNKKSIKSGV